MKFIFLNTKTMFLTNVLVVHLFFKNKTIEKMKNDGKINGIYKGVFRDVRYRSFFIVFDFVNSLFSPPIYICFLYDFE